MPVMISTELQVLSSSAQNDLLAEESGPLLPSVLPAPEVTKRRHNNDGKTMIINHEWQQDKDYKNKSKHIRAERHYQYPWPWQALREALLMSKASRFLQFLDCWEITRTIFCPHLFQMKTVFKLFYISDGDQLSKSPICNAPPHSKHFNTYIMENELNYTPIWHSRGKRVTCQNISCIKIGLKLEIKSKLSVT